MADEKVNIVVKVITKTKQLDALLAKIKLVEALEDRLSSAKNVQKYAQGAGAALSRATLKWKKHFDFVDSGIRMFGKTLTKFLKFAIKGVLIEMGLLSVAMVGWHALVKGGQYIVKAYHGVLQLLAGGAAAATIAIATVSAAIREQQAAMYAYRGKGARQFGSGMNQTAMAMRNLQMNAELASLGVEALNGAYASMSKTMKVTQINRSGASIKALMDFGAAGQDPKKTIAQVGTIVAVLNDEKKSLSNVISEAKKLGPEMEKALKGTKIKTKKQFKELLMSGELAKKGGVLGQFDAVNETLIGQLTKYFTLLRGKFADFGEQFLGPVKVAFEKIFKTISRDLSRLMTSIMFNPGGETFIDGLANGVEKFSGWLVKTIRDYLPKIQGMFGRMGDWWSNFKRGWNLVLERLRPLIDGARVIEKAFGQVWQAIKEGAENMGHFRKLLLANESTVIETGTRIGDLIRDVSDLFFRMKTVFFEILPFLNDVLSGIGMLIRGMTKLLTGLGGGGGGFAKALGPLLAFQIFGSRMMGAAGKLMPGITGQQKSLPFSNVSTMPVTATNVYVNGSPVPGAGAAGAGSGRMSSGGGGGGAGMAGPIHPYGPTQQAYNSYYGPALSRLYSTSNAAQLADFGAKTAAIGHRELKGPRGKGILIGQAVTGSNLPTAWSRDGIPITNQFIPERDFQQTTAVGKNGAPVFQDVRALGGVYLNNRGIAMGASQTSQSVFGRIKVDPRMRLGESMRVGRLMKQGFEAGDMYRAGMDRRAYERQFMLATPGAGMVTPVPGVHMALGMNGSRNMVMPGGINPNIDYERLSNRRLSRLVASRGLGGGMGREEALAAIKQNDLDRRIAHRVAAGEISMRDARLPGMMSESFRTGEFERWKETTRNKETGEREYTGRVVDPGLTARERLTRSSMAFGSRLRDVSATAAYKARGVAGMFQGAMGYLNDGRFDPTLNDGKGDFVNVEKMRQEARDRMMQARNEQNRGRFATRLSYTREMARIARSETKFGAGQKRFAQSGTGRMGTSMGLAMASQFAPEEMRGAMALGGTLSMIDPRLGLAVAGVGGALKAKSVGAGALAGAAGGAQIGALFGPAGAAIGAGIGLLAGGIMGAINKHKDQMKKATKAAQGTINSMFTGLASAASRQFDLNREAQALGLDMSKQKSAFGSIVSDFQKKREIFADNIKKGELFKSFDSADAANKDSAAIALIEDIYSRQSQFGITMTAEMKKDALLKPTKYVEELTKIGGAFDKSMQKMQDVNSDRLKQLTRDTGKSEAELELLAQELGINLYDATVKYKDLAKSLGATLIKTASQLNDALADAFIKRGDPFTKNIKQREAELAIDRSAQGFRDKLMSKDATAEEKTIATDEFFASFADQNLAANKGNALDAYLDSYNMFMRGDGDAFKEGNVFGGMSEADTAIAKTAGETLTTGYREDIVAEVTGQLAAIAASNNMSFDQGALKKQVAGLLEADFIRLARGMQNGVVDRLTTDEITGLSSGEAGINKLLNWANIDKSKTGIKAIDAGVEGEGLDKFTGDLKDVAQKMKLDYDEFNRAVTLYKTTTESFFKGSAGGPDWWQKGLTWDGTTLKPDTATPRGGQIGDTTTSKLSQTMARHQAMDGQLTGKRSVTSSWRNFNLGSSNSDHITGRAYDLVGQNLGKYATMIHANGGFAEFHGNMAERHLHVVPGPVPGVGDKSVPAMSTTYASLANSPAAGPGNYTININGANASPEAIANMVVARLDDRERKYRER